MKKKISIRSVRKNDKTILFRTQVLHSQNFALLLKHSEFVLCLSYRDIKRYIHKIHVFLEYLLVSK